MEDTCELRDTDLVMAERYADILCERLRNFHLRCCTDRRYVATIVLEGLMRNANELRHQIINLRDAMELEHDDREVQPMPEESRDVQEEAAE